LGLAIFPYVGTKTTLTRKVTMKNSNALMVESLDKLINVMKDKAASPKKFEQFKRDMIKLTIKTKSRIGDTEFLNSKEWKQYLIQQKLDDIEKDF
jgi:16S rRNA A1518/A1519 N6-dimethyltransferase RsmA/KsgA/DIM1 with predicted DNA glycosylase/AP lyase activity